MLHQLILIATVLMAGGVQATAQETRVVAEVRGLSCPFCAYGLEKQFKEMPGVTNVRIDVEEGLLMFTWTGVKDVDRKDVKRRIKRAGFSAGKITITETGPDRSNRAANGWIRA